MHVENFVQCIDIRARVCTWCCSLECLIDCRKVISESSQVNAQAYVSALRRENRPKALAIAAVVVLIPVLLALMCVALAVKVGRDSEELLKVWRVYYYCHY